jgi:hypothetical protein
VAASDKRAGKAALRIFMAHGLAYPIATAWAFASVPVLVVNIASRVGLSLDDATIAHLVLLRVAWPTVGAFVLVHVAGVYWGVARDEARARRVFVVTLVGLAAVAVVGGGISWLCLMAR